MDVLSPPEALRQLLEVIENEAVARKEAAADPSKTPAHLTALEQVGAAKARAKASLRFHAEAA